MTRPTECTEPLSDAAGGFTERRVCDRHYYGQVLFIRFIARPNFQSLRAILHDVSPSGIGLVVHSPVPAQTALAVRLQSKCTGVSGILAAIVRHSRQLGENCWLLGCSLSRNLSESELEALRKAS